MVPKSRQAMHRLVVKLLHDGLAASEAKDGYAGSLYGLIDAVYADIGLGWWSLRTVVELHQQRVCWQVTAVLYTGLISSGL